MSYDFNVQLAPCDHMQSGERYVVDSFDFRTLHLAANPSLNMRAPINGQKLVRLFIGGSFVPQNHPVYGYDILPDTNRLDTLDKFYKIVFRQPMRAYVPLVEVNYVTVKTFCLKCSATGQLNDFKKSISGSLVRIVGKSKLAQKVLKIVLTSRCPFYPKFVCRVKDYVGRKFGVGITDTDIASEIVNSLSNLKSIQTAQSSVQNLDPQEVLKDITNIVTTKLDPTSVAVQATIWPYGDGTPQPVSFSLTSTKNLVGQ